MFLCLDAHVSPMLIKFTKVSIIAMNVECIPPVGFLATQIYVTMGTGDNWFSGTVTKLSPESLVTSCAAHVAVCKSSQLIFAGVKYSTFIAIIDTFVNLIGMGDTCASMHRNTHTLPFEHLTQADPAS